MLTMGGAGAPGQVIGPVEAYRETGWREKKPTVVEKARKKKKRKTNLEHQHELKFLYDRYGASRGTT